MARKQDSYEHPKGHEQARSKGQTAPKPTCSTGEMEQQGKCQGHLFGRKVEYMPQEPFSESLVSILAF